VTLDEGQSIAGFTRRKQLLDDVDTAFTGFEQLDDEVRSLDRFAERAHDIIASPRTREAFDLSRESPAVANRFGTHEFGQSFLLAHRPSRGRVPWRSASSSSSPVHPSSSSSDRAVPRASGPRSAGATSPPARVVSGSRCSAVGGSGSPPSRRGSLT
jgi:hypothetical protein